MTRLIDLFPGWENGAFFTLMSLSYQSDMPWLTSEVATDLDFNYFGGNSGGKIPSPLVDRLLSDDTLSQANIAYLVRLAHNRFHRQWNRLWNVYSVEYNPINNYDMSETETPNLTHSRTTATESDFTVTSDADTNTNIYAFNSDVASPQGASDGSSTVNTKGSKDDNYVEDVTMETGTRTLTRSGNIGVTTSQQMIQSEIELWKWDFFEQIFSDLDKILTIPIY